MEKLSKRFHSYVKIPGNMHRAKDIGADGGIAGLEVYQLWRSEFFREGKAS